MTNQNNAETSELTLKPVDGDAGGTSSVECKDYDGGFSLLSSAQSGIGNSLVLTRTRCERDAFQEFTFG